MSEAKGDEARGLCGVVRLPVRRDQEGGPHEHI